MKKIFISNNDFFSKDQRRDITLFIQSIVGDKTKVYFDPAYPLQYDEKNNIFYFFSGYTSMYNSIDEIIAYKDWFSSTFGNLIFYDVNKLTLLLPVLHEIGHWYDLTGCKNEVSWEEWQQRAVYSFVKGTRANYPLYFELPSEIRASEFAVKFLSSKTEEEIKTLNDNFLSILFRYTNEE